MSMQRNWTRSVARDSRCVLGFVCLLATSCYNPDERCGEGQEYSSADELCVCQEGLRTTPDGCEEIPEEPASAGEAETEVPEQSGGDGASMDDAEATDASPGDDEGTAADAPMEEGTPDNLGAPCSTSDDCAEGGATFCDAFVTGACLIEGCELGGSDCPIGYACQDLSMFGAAGNVCVAAPCDIAADDCPDGFTCCEAPIPGIPPSCLQNGCGG